MVFCRECKKKVEDCQHFVAPLDVLAIPVFDPKIKTLLRGDLKRLCCIKSSLMSWKVF
jgi:hypothetical protein